MQRWLSIAALLLVTPGLVGCIGTDENVDPTTNDLGAAITRVEDRAALPFRTDDDWSHTLVEGAFGILPALSLYVDVEVPLGNGVPVQQAHMGVFLPDIPGCDWEASTLPDTCKVPVVADIGPYYADGDAPATSPDTGRLGGFLIENLVPHGYAVAQVSVMGTGLSGGCMDLMGEVEQAGIHAAVDALGAAAWSNGAVGIIGRSYDGSTPWEAAMYGSEYVKTVVPISGLYGQHELMWRNGSAEFRGPGLLWGIYYTFALTPGEAGGPGLPLVGPVAPEPGYAPTHAQRLAENTICPDTQTGGAQAVAAYATADQVFPEVNSYWTEREFGTEVLENYQGSVYFIHGMQDWNVDPHMAFPFYNQLEAKGLEMKGLFGQWQHMYPDRPGEHEGMSSGEGGEASHASVRWDWAQDLLEWFDHYLKGTGAKPQLHVEIQDNTGAWRIEPTWPPADRTIRDLVFGVDLTTGDDNVIIPNGGLGGEIAAEITGATPPGSISLVTEALAEETRIAGLPKLHVTVTPMGPGGQLYAELRDLDNDGLRLGHAIMDLRLHDGGKHNAMPVTPGMPIVAKMEFEPMDVVVPAGHRLELVLSSTGRDYLPATVSDPIMVEIGSDSVLKLPTIVRGPEAFFTPAGHAEHAE